jgi:hypothetical protein
MGVFTLRLPLDTYIWVNKCIPRSAGDSLTSQAMWASTITLLQISFIS